MLHVADDSITILESRSSIAEILHKKKSLRTESASPIDTPTFRHIDISKLRVDSNDADESFISDSNLSDVCEIDEFPENASRKSEKILEQLGDTANPEDLSLGDPDLEHLLDDPDEDSVPQDASTPTRAASSHMSYSSHNSEPATGTETDIVNSEPNRGEELVTTKTKTDFINFIFNDNYLSKCRIPRLVSEGAATRATYEDSHRLEVIIATHFINYLFSNLFIYYYHYSGTTVSNASLSSY